MAIPTVVGLKQHLNIAVTTYDNELLTFLAAARRMIERRVGPMAIIDVTETIVSRGGCLLLTTRPVTALVSATAPVGGATLDVTTLAFNSLAGDVRYATGAPVAGTWRVTYQAGLDVVPESVELATYITVQHLWKTQRGGAQRPGMGGDDSQSTLSSGYALPWMAVELIAADDISVGFA